MTDPAINKHMTERFSIKGDVGSAVFPKWIARHAARLGLEERFIAQDAACVTVVLSGPLDLLDAMALGCSLGPQEIWVDEVDRAAENDGQALNFA